MLELKHINVSFRTERQDRIFGHTRQQVLFDVSMTVRDGTCLGILGESGSGKSTMGRVLCGLLKPDSGEAVLDGVPIYGSRAGRRNLQNKLSVVFPGEGHHRGGTYRTGAAGREPAGQELGGR